MISMKTAEEVSILCRFRVFLANVGRYGVADPVMELVALCGKIFFPGEENRVRVYELLH